VLIRQIAIACRNHHQNVSLKLNKGEVLDTKDLMRLALGLSKRAESYDAEHLAASFVEIGNVPTLLRNNDSAIIFGRRGTGKTHLLSYLASQIKLTGTVAISIDMRTIGSSSGLYSDPGINLSERATRLLRDTGNAIHEGILEAYTDPNSGPFGSGIIAGLDQFVDAANNVSIDGAVTREQAIQENNERTSNAQVGGTASATPSFTASYGTTSKLGFSEIDKESVSGKEFIRINFGSLTSALDRIVKNLPKQRLWILLDEWSEVPLDLQPYLADMLKRGFLAVGGVTAKIAAIEHRSNLRLVNEKTNQSVGIELGADVAMSVNLDDHMVFDNDSAASSQFFAQMLFRHVKTLAIAEKLTFDIPTTDDLTRQMFTQRDCFNEFVRASEGVPRDAINILSKCALKSNSEKISMQTVRNAARTWYNTSKQNDISSRPKALALMDWIMNEVIGKRKARGFLLDVKARDNIIDFLFDSRVLHIVKKGISSKDGEDSGKKFNAWVLDYGCYVDLFNTVAAPRGLFEAEEELAASQTKYVDVPQTDYRSLRRAILDLTAFYAASTSV
jgi:hypothetical protein